MNYKVAVKNVKPGEKEEWMTGYLERQLSTVKGIQQEVIDAVDLSDFKSLIPAERFLLLEEKNQLRRLTNVIEARKSLWEERWKKKSKK